MRVCGGEWMRWGVDAGMTRGGLRVILWAGGWGPK